jgi:chemotaxis methyl-accepting protein methylase
MLPAGDRALNLAQGELAAADQAEFDALKAQIHAESGFFCAGYKEKCLRRRLAIRMRARGAHRYSEYGELLRRDRAEYEKLLAVLTINVSKFFRNIEVWRVLEREVVPALFALRTPQVRIWSAGSAGGEEAYSVAIMLREYARKHGLMERLRRFTILGSDIDREVLEVARRAEYGETAFGEIPQELLERWFDAGPRHRLRDEVRQMVRFEPLDLLSDPYPADQHLILCRNVTIYFERAETEALLERMRSSLAPGGYLVIGKVEVLFGQLAREFRPITHRERIYQCL